MSTLHKPSGRTPNAQGTAPRKYEPVGWLLGLLLLFAGPAFYILLWLKPFSPFVRIVWGLWVGLIIFVSVSGMAEPVFSIREVMEEQGFEQEVIPEKVSLEAYLKRLEGGPLGVLITEHTVEAGTITLEFMPNESYFDSDAAIAQIGIGSGYSLLYGRDFEQVVFHIPYRNARLVMALSREDFRGFFGLREEDMRAIGESNERFAESPLRAPAPETLQAFYQQFTHFE